MTAKMPHRDPTADVRADDVLVRSPLGITLVPGKSGWECACRSQEEHEFNVLTGHDLLNGFEMGFAAATIDPWDGRCKLEPLMEEVVE